jgi:hypothetical protein
MGKPDKTLAAVFRDPAPANLPWRDIESLLTALGAELSAGAGSRLRVRLHGVRAVLHRPHPSSQATRPQVRSVRLFLQQAGVKP